MSDETPAPRGDAAWKAQREEIARKNADAHRRSQAAQNERSSRAATSARADAEREAEQLRTLNKRLSKLQARAGR